MLTYTNTAQFITDYRDFLKANGISNVHIARQIGISPQNLQNLYNKKELTITDVQRLLEAVGMSLDTDIRQRAYIYSEI